MKQLIKNCNVFDGNHRELRYSANIAIEDDLVTEIFQGDFSEEQFDCVIDGKGHTAIPGLIDAHIHLALTGGGDEMEPLRADETAVRAAKNAEECLLRGFTTVRDGFALFVSV